MALRSLALATCLLVACGDPEINPGRDGGSGRDGAPAGCEPPEELCGGRCVNVLSHADHCGACGNACPDGAFCSNGECGRSCSGGLFACGASCVDPATDRANCGGCGNACPEDRACLGGRCQCPEGYVECDGTCVDTDNDTSHCGLCGRACAADQACNMGSCTCSAEAREADCTNGTDDDCDMLADCEDSDCVGATRMCMGMCGAGTETCGAGGTWGACAGGDGSAEICGDGIDQDCDGFDIRIPDAWEPNDSCGECATISGTDPNVYVDATMDSVYDPVDCYKITAHDGCCAREFIRLDLTNIPAGADYDVYLYANRADCDARNALASSSNPGNGDEHVEWGERFAADDSGEYYIRVVRYRGHSCDASYRLTINGLN